MSTYPDDADGNALRRMAEAGTDMSQPLVIEFPITAANQIAARAIEQALTQQRYQVVIDYDEGHPDDDSEFGPEWTVYVRIQIVPTYTEVVRIQVELDRIATPLGGRSAGWDEMLY